MAQITTKKIVEGLNNLVLHAYFESDGFEGEMNNVVLLSPSELIPPLPGAPTFRIVKIWAALNFALTLKYNSQVPTPVWVISGGFSQQMDFDRFGGLSDYTATNSDGKLLVSSSGFASSGTNGSLVIEFRKP